jgi:NTP pyrophosphatase (non-canonical NTP hydrolase)
MEILVITAEECSEVIKEITKIVRFGYDSCHPDNPNLTNRDNLTEEIGDLMHMIHLLTKHGIVSADAVEMAAQKKKEKLLKFSRIPQ